MLLNYIAGHAYILVGLFSLVLLLLPHSLPTALTNTVILIGLPGWSIVRLWKEHIPSYEKVLYSIGLSLCFLLVLGLLLNTMLPIFGISKPLAQSITEPVLFAIIFILSTYSLHKKKLEIQSYHVVHWTDYLLLVGLCLPIIVVAGANRLNALPGDWVATFALVLIVLYTLVVAWIAKSKRSQRLIPAHLFLLVVSLLWMYSLRSHYIFGFDINQEYHYFNQTLLAGRWTPSHNSYSACLSITILPTIIANYTHIAAESIFKVIYPALFSLVPVAVYAIGRRFFTTFAAFLGSLLYVFQVAFLFQATALARQEIATLFLSVALLAFFNQKWTLTKRNIVFLLFSFGMILSHYSTTYVAIAGYLVTFLVITSYSYIRPKPQRANHLSGSILVILIIGTIGWNLQITQSSANLFLTIRQSFRSIPQLFQTDAPRSSVAQSILGGNKISASAATESYIAQQNINSQASLANNITNVPLSGPTTSRTATLFIQGVPLLIKLFVVMSVPFLFLSKKKIPDSYKLLATATLIFGVVLVLVPNLSLDYNVERMYQQGLILLAVPTTYLMLRVSARLGKIAPILVVSILFAYFLTTSSLIDKMLFNWSNANIGNSNEAYYTFFTTDGDAAAARWVNLANVHGETVYGDRYGALVLTAFTSRVSTRNIQDNLVKGVVSSRNYIYLTTTNLKYNRAYYQIDGQVFSFTTPRELIVSQSNTVYSNQQAIIYR